jgi:hypothetical protein
LPVSSSDIDGGVGVVIRHSSFILDGSVFVLTEFSCKSQAIMSGVSELVAEIGGVQEIITLTSESLRSRLAKIERMNRFLRNQEGEVSDEQVVSSVTAQCSAIRDIAVLLHEDIQDSMNNLTKLPNNEEDDSENELQSLPSPSHSFSGDENDENAGQYFWNRSPPDGNPFNLRFSEPQARQGHQSQTMALVTQPIFLICRYSPRELCQLKLNRDMCGIAWTFSCSFSSKVSTIHMISKKSQKSSPCII